MGVTTAARHTRESSPCNVVELRQYTLVPAMRDTLVELFEREFVESQETAGLRVLGHFRDVDDPDRFVWLRSFPGMKEREAALSDFYFGPVWKQHREAANSTMIDSDNVLLLRPFADDKAALEELTGWARPAPSEAATAGSGIITVTVYSFAEEPSDEAITWFVSSFEDAMVDLGAPRLALLRTEDAQNTFPGLPVREGEHVVVRIAAFASLTEHARHQAEYAGSAADRAVRERMVAEPVALRLAPASRSLLR